MTGEKSIKSSTITINDIYEVHDGRGVGRPVACYKGFADATRNLVSQKDGEDEDCKYIKELPERVFTYQNVDDGTIERNPYPSLCGKYGNHIDVNIVAAIEP